MSSRKLSAPTPSLLGSVHAAEPALKKQSRYGNSPWKPGEVPARGASLMPITEPIEVPVNAPYGEFLGIETPRNRGSGWPTKADLEEK
jgi:hypothetical protein